MNVRECACVLLPAVRVSNCTGTTSNTCPPLFFCPSAHFFLHSLGHFFLHSLGDGTFFLHSLGDGAPWIASSKLCTVVLAIVCAIWQPAKEREMHKAEKSERKIASERRERCRATTKMTKNDMSRLFVPLLPAKDYESHMKQKTMKWGETREGEGHEEEWGEKKKGAKEPVREIEQARGGRGEREGQSERERTLWSFTVFHVQK